MTTRLHCSFCGKSEDDVRKLAAGPGGIHICDACVATCQVIMHDESTTTPFDPTSWPQERLLALLRPVDATIDAHRRHLQTIVETLRAQNVSWAVIAENLGVSRQTAWERFS